MLNRMGSSSDAGTSNAASTAAGNSPRWVTATTGPRRARISSIVETFLPCGITTTVGRLRRDQRQRPVFELGGRIGLGVQVADLLELERALQRHRIAGGAADEISVLAGEEPIGQMGDLCLSR